MATRIVFLILLIVTCLLTAVGAEEPRDYFEYLARGHTRYEKRDFSGAVADYSEAIRLKPKDAWVYLYRAKARRDSLDPKGAIADCTEALDLIPRFTEAYLVRGQAKAALGNDEEAIPDFSKAIELDPNYTQAYVERAAAKRKSLSNDTAGILADCTRAIEIDPQYAPAYWELGKAKLIGHDYDGAIVAATKVIKLWPRSSGGYSLRADARHHKGDEAGAIMDYSLVVELDPSDLGLVKMLLLARYEPDKVSRTICQRLITRYPKDADAHETYAAILKQMGDLTGALAAANTAVDLAPERHDILRTRAEVKTAMGDLAAAVEDLSAALSVVEKQQPTGQRFESMGDLKRRRADLKSMQGDYPGALADVRAVCELDPNNYLAWVQLGDIHLQMDQLTNAVAHYTHAVEMAPENLAAYIQRGYASLALGELNTAISDFNSVLHRNPKHAAALVGLADARYLNRNWAEALRDYRQAVALSPQGKIECHLRIYLVRSRIGEGESAGKQLLDYLQANKLKPTSSWFAAKAYFLCGKLTENELLKAAVVKEEKIARAKAAEAFFYVGMKCLLHGDKDKARDRFRKCINTGAANSADKLAAKAELTALESGSGPRESGHLIINSYNNFDAYSESYKPGFNTRIEC